MYERILPRDISTLAVLWWIRHHDSTLSSPQKTSAYSQHGTSEDQETRVLGVVVAKKSSDVERVSESTEGQGKTDTEFVRNGAGEETDHREGGVESGVGIIGWLLVDLSTTT